MVNSYSFQAFLKSENITNLNLLCILRFINILLTGTLNSIAPMSKRSILVVFTVPNLFKSVQNNKMI